ncbi:MAG: hypothetical protein IKH00_06365 [Bacteroidales bacterium]|nr:hypothetical protein [Bacteroidales bacterium]
MKTKYIIVSLIAALGLLFTGCVEEADHYLDEVKVSSSYVTFAAGGGSVPVELNATGSWSVTNLPEWVTVSPATGGAGQVTVTFTAPAAEETRDAVATIECGGKTQNINLLQTTQKAEPVTMTVKQALEVIAPLGDGDVAGGTYRVKGIVCKINEISTQYGNTTYFLSDDGSYGENNWLEVYRGLWINGAAITTGNEFSVGDELTIEGSLMNYKGTPETKEKTAIVVSHVKSLISVDAFDFDELPCVDTTFKMVVTAKESPLLVSSDADWLQITDVNKDGSYSVHALENTRTAKRTANVTIKGPTALKTIGITQAGAPSTGASISEIIEAADNDQVQTLPTTVVVALTTKGAVLSDGKKAIYAYGDKAAALKIGDGVKVAGTKTTYNGVPEITDLTEVFVDSEGNSVEHPTATDITANAAEYTASVAEYIKLSGTLSVSSDGKYYNMTLDGIDPDTKQGSIVYPVDALNAKSFDGKKITVTGYFNGLSSKGKFINVIATKIDEFVDNPKGTATNPYTASEIAKLLLGGTTFDEDIYIKGKVSDILYDFSTYNGTGTFWISDDGTCNLSDDKKKTNDPTHDFEVYSVYWFGGEAWTEGKAQVRIGDEVIVCGKTTVYNGVAETASKKAQLYSVNGATTDANGLGNAEYPFNIAGAIAFIDVAQAAIEAAKAADEPEPVFPDVCVKGKVADILYEYSTYAGTATFWISDDGSCDLSADKKNTNNPTHDFEVYGAYYFGNQPWVEGNGQVAVGDEVIVKGQLTKYKSTYETASKKAWLYSQNGKTE